MIKIEPNILKFIYTSALLLFPLITQAEVAVVKDSVIVKDSVVVKAKVTINAKIIVKARRVVQDISLNDVIFDALSNNSELLNAQLNWFSAKHKRRGAYGDFEPSLVGNYKYTNTEAPNKYANERRQIYDVSLEGTFITGLTYNAGLSHTGYANKHNKLTKSNVFTGIQLSQPLLKGLWFGSPVNGIKITKEDQKIAYHNYRSTLTNVLFQINLAYFQLLYAENILVFAIKSEETAKTIVKDSKIRLRTGKMSKLNVVEAEAGLASRITARVAANQEVLIASNELKLLIGNSSYTATTQLHSLGKLSDIINVDDIDSSDFISRIQQLHPDFLVKTHELKRELLIHNSYLDQSLPELNITANLGIEGEGSNPELAFEKFGNPNRRDHIRSIGLEFKLPLLGGWKERAFAKAEKQTVRSAYVNLLDSRYKLYNYVVMLVARIKELRENLKNVSQGVEFREKLLNAEFKKLNVGKSSYHQIYEIEDKLTQARQWELENLLTFHEAHFQLLKLSGEFLLYNKLENIEDKSPLLIGKLMNPDKENILLNMSRKQMRIYGK